VTTELMAAREALADRDREIARLLAAIKAIFDAKDQDERDRAFDAAEEIAREGR
jgi:hypothetical protein